MALDLGTIRGTIKIDASGAKRSIKDVRKGLNSLGTAALDVGAKLAALGGAAVVGGLAKAVKESANLEQAIASASAVTKEGQKNFDAFKEAAVEAGLKSAFSAKQAGDALRFLSMAGFQASQSVQALPDVLSLAAAGATDLATTADIASNIMSGFGISASEFTAVADKLTATFTSSNTNLEQLGAAMSYAAPAAKATGQSLSEMAAAVGRMSDAGIQGSKAGTALRMAIVKLQRPTRMTRRALADLGLNAQDLQGNFLDALGTLDKAGASFGQISAIFGSEAAPAIQKLMDDGIDSIRAFADEIESSAGRAADVEAQMLNTLSGQVKILEGSISTTAASFGDVLAPAIKGVTKDLIGQVNAFGQDKEAMADFVDEILRLSSDLQDVIAVLAMTSAALVEIARVAKVTMDLMSLFGTAVGGTIKALSLDLEGLARAEAQFEEQWLGLKGTASNVGKSLGEASDVTDKLAAAAKRAREEVKKQTAAMRKQSREAKKLAELTEKIRKNSPTGIGNYGRNYGQLSGGGAGSSGSSGDGGGSSRPRVRRTRSRAPQGPTLAEATKENMAITGRILEEHDRKQKAKLREDMRIEGIAARQKEKWEKERKEREEKAHEAAKKATEAKLQAVEEEGRMTREAAAARARAFREAIQSVGETSQQLGMQMLDMAGMGSLGGVISSAGKMGATGMALGGPAGAGAGAALGAMQGGAQAFLSAIREHEKFEGVMRTAQQALASMGLPDITGKLLEALQFGGVAFKRIGAAFKPVTEAFGGLLPTSEQLFVIMKKWGLGVINLIQGINNAYNAMTSGMSTISGTIANFVNTLNSNKFLSRFLPDELVNRVNATADTWAKANRVSDDFAASLDGAEKNLKDLTFEEAEGELSSFRDTLADTNRELRNVPTGFKTALRAFQADDAGRGGGGVASLQAGSSFYGPQTGSGVTPLWFLGGVSGRRQQRGSTVSMTTYLMYNDGA